MDPSCLRRCSSCPLSFGRSTDITSAPSTRTKMTSVAVVPACLMAAVSVVQPPHLEGDPSLATEILPGPPSLASIQQAGASRRDHKKTVLNASYLPLSDPGTTYGANTVSTMAAATTEVDGPRRKRARLDKGCVFSPHPRPSVADHGLQLAPRGHAGLIMLPNNCRSLTPLATPSLP